MQGQHGQQRGGDPCLVLVVGLHGVVTAQPLPPFCHTEGASEISYLDSTGTSEPLIFRGVDPARAGTEPLLTLVKVSCYVLSALQCPAHKHNLLEDSGVIFLFSSKQLRLTTGFWTEEKSALPMSLWKIFAGEIEPPRTKG